MQKAVHRYRKLPQTQVTPPVWWRSVSKFSRCFCLYTAACIYIFLYSYGTMCCMVWLCFVFSHLICHLLTVIFHSSTAIKLFIFRLNVSLRAAQIDASSCLINLPESNSTGALESPNASQVDLLVVEPSPSYIKRIASSTGRVTWSSASRNLICL